MTQIYNLKQNIYNADEADLLWRTLPECIEASKYKHSNFRRQIGKFKISVLLYINADESHRPTSVFVEKLQELKFRRCNAEIKYIWQI